MEESWAQKLRSIAKRQTESVVDMTIDNDNHLILKKIDSRELDSGLIKMKKSGSILYVGKEGLITEPDMYASKDGEIWVPVSSIGRYLSSSVGSDAGCWTGDRFVVGALAAAHVCPTFRFTSGNFIQGLGTWDGGTKITVLQTNGFIVTRSYPDFTFLYSRTLSSTIPNYAARVINCTITDDGFMFVYVRRTTPNPGFMSLFKHDIASGVSTVHDAPVTDNNRLTGPSWNPYDGMVYEFWPDSGTYKLLRWDPSTPGDPTVIWTTPGFDFSSSNMVTFTEDGGMWFSFEDPVLLDGSRPYRLDLNTLDLLIFDELYAAGNAGIPNGPSSVVTSNVDSVGASLPGVNLFSNGSVTESPCELFASDGTARVHCGVNGLMTFLYPTAGGTGVDIYELAI